MQTYTPDYNQSILSRGNLSGREKSKEKKKERPRISPAQIQKMMREVEANFIKPTAQAELGGKLGATLSDVAVNLGVSHAELKRKIERSGDIEYITAFNHEILTYVIIPSPGKKSDSYVMDIQAIQHIISNYNNFAGRYYLDYLIRCQKALTVSLEGLQQNSEEIQQLKKELEESRRKNTTTKIRNRKECEYNVILGEDYQKHVLNGVQRVACVTKKPLKKMTNIERGMFNIQQNIRKAFGLLKSSMSLLKKHECGDKQIMFQSDYCLDALDILDSQVNKTGLERALIPTKAEKVNRLGAYIQPPLFENDGVEPKYIN